MQQAETRRARKATVNVVVVIEIVDIFQYELFRPIATLSELSILLKKD